ncbi:UPF0061-domain-containing protein [Rhizoclosmatium globosum]|uniref:Selenoprotein O n=1 Tax=Rhizoclosmatium globosum TaxID=329046 RepID=A0A1Y2CSP6_9FUNG|nr:UPF0061-domain-containing protein [Rhizoclosmatium globosum]|eukprot:ORY50022.1 UPF0061-domain-containing protein [Rhizoclosmatium globosum]
MALWQKRKLKDALGMSDHLVQSLPADPLTPRNFSSAASPGVLPPSQDSVQRGIAEAEAAAAAHRRTQDIMRQSRCVRAAAYSFVAPEPIADPIVLCISRPTCKMLSLDPDDPDIGYTISGTRVSPELSPYAHNYGGHQFGYYVGQLGDGRCVSLGEISIFSKDTIPKRADSISKLRNGSTTSDSRAQLLKNIEGSRKGSVIATTPFMINRDNNPILKKTVSVHHFTHSQYEVQVKGSGRTPYARPVGDGRASLRGCIREFLACEYMDALGIPTTRALGLVGGSTGVYRDKGLESGGIVARVAPSFIRFGSFELFWYRGEMDLLRQLADYVITFHFPEIDNQKQELEVMHRTAKVPAVTKGTGGGLIGPYTDETLVTMQLNRYGKLYLEVVKDTAYLCAAWQAAGFIHGVLNTDNMSVHGITLDYGPFLFMDTYDPCLCSSSTDVVGRYRFENQPNIMFWNLYKFGRCLVDLVVKEEISESGQPIPGIDGKDVIERILDSFETVFINEYTEIMTKKLGIMNMEPSDLEVLIDPLLQLLCDTDTDYVQFFRALQQIRLTEAEFKVELGPMVADPFAPKTESTNPPLVLQYMSLEDFQQFQIELVARGKSTVNSMGSSPALTSTNPTPINPKEEIEILAQANAENAKCKADKSPSGCLDLLVNSMKQGIADTMHEVEVLSFMQKRASVVPSSPSTKRSSVASRAASPKKDKAGGGIPEESEILEDSEDDIDDDVFPLVDIMRKSVRRASTILMERERRASVQSAGAGGKDKENGAADATAVKNESGPTEVSEVFPEENDVKYRWQEWLIKYRSRLITEMITLRPNVPLTEANPRFNLRGWILEEICDKVTSLPECAPVDVELMRLKEELKILADAEARTIASATKLKVDDKPEEAATEDDLDNELQELLAKLKRGEPLKPTDDAVKKQQKPLGMRLSGQGVEVLNQAMRILVGDIWGEITDSNAGWDSVFDKEAAARWGGKVPKRKDNMVLSPSS